ncbi:hypothetical protein SteCoe_4601 [Stentor coeruleus]|uniref:GST N-terminal domain-containing protein n=1 Tax=Stentor coeruleus TaxID=5963 RepID=A0A1R2CUD1_9CILI|nr:hypothetical protein SteCoe_4601 [Stentor coeruleus]
MSIQLELFIHPMCPFAQRVLYVMAYKGIQCQIKEIDLVKKPDWFLEVNPKGLMPALKVTTSNRVCLLHDSIVISEYFESFPGPYLYPRLTNDVVDSLEKAVLDIIMSTSIDALKRQIGQIYYNATPNDRELGYFRRTIAVVEDLIPDGKYFGFKALGKDEITLIDLLALPLIERIVAFKDLGLPYYQGVNLQNILSWYSRIRQLPCVKAYEMPLIRYVNLRKYMQSNKYEGLSLPASNYDSPPKI